MQDAVHPFRSHMTKNQIMHPIVAVTIIAITLVASCSRTAGTGEEVGPGETPEEPVQLTLFSEDTEFFLEYDPPTAGTESGFLVHVTNLETYKPYPGPTLTVEMDGDPVWNGEPDNPGIFRLSLTPEHPGEHTVKLLLEAGPQFDSTEFHMEVRRAGDAGDHDHEEDADHDHAEGTDAGDHDHDIAGDHDHEEAAEHPDEIVFLKEQAWRNDFMVEEARLQPFSWVIRTGGEFLAVPGKKRSLAASSPGIITFADRELVQGSKVMEDQEIFFIITSNLTENNVELRYREYLNALQKSRSQYLRHLTLRHKGVVSEQQLLESRTEYVADSLRFQSLSEQFSGQGVKVVGPITGYIHHLNVSEGDYVELGQILVTISSNQRLLLRADLPQHRFDLLDEIVTANFRPAFTEKTYRVADLDGSILSKGSSVAENNHYLPIFFELRNDGTLLEGAFADVYLQSGTGEEKIAVPVSAIVEELGNQYVYLQEGGETYYRLPVKTGQTDGIRTEVLSGIGPGQRIVTRGTMLLKAASMVTAGSGDHGHAH